MAFKAIALVFMVCVFGANCKILNVRNCDSSAPIQIGKVNLKSYPIRIQPGANIEASGSYRNNYDALTSQSVLRVQFKVQKKFGWFGYRSIPFFCSTVGGCTQNIKCGDIPSPVPLCPGDQGDLKFDESITIPSKLPGLSSVIKSFINGLGSGKYKATVDVKDAATGQRIVCVKDVEVEVELKL